MLIKEQDLWVPSESGAVPQEQGPCSGGEGHLCACLDKQQMPFSSPEVSQPVPTVHSRSQKSGTRALGRGPR